MINVWTFLSNLCTGTLIRIRISKADPNHCVIAIRMASFSACISNEISNLSPQGQEKGFSPVWPPSWSRLAEV